ncbi:MAG TPA: NfeD family protein [Opitutaceae bacterium]|jgi:membrane-bound ClpP family serine protease|nr:NfeD family protein [Opitutaceae bacterium]
MTLLVILFAAGILLLALDVFAASFILAAIGGAVMLAGCGVAYRHFGAVGAGLAGVAALLLLGATLYFELWVLPETRLGRGMVVRSTSGPESRPAAPEAVVGQSASALTTLAPSGYVLVDGRRYEAFCQSGHAAKGADLRVVGVDNFRVIVTQ